MDDTMSVDHAVAGPVAPVAGRRQGATRWRRLLLLVTAVLAVAAPLAPGITAEAKKLPPGYRPNGCTMSPDIGYWPVYYNFKNQCNRHDYCYDELWYGGGATGRKKCDDLFLREMQGWCNSFYGKWWLIVERGKCHGVAATYYSAVRAFGGPYFDNPYKN